jgi:hypothetical protein
MERETVSGTEEEMERGNLEDQDNQVMINLSPHFRMLETRGLKG